LEVYLNEKKIRCDKTDGFFTYLVMAGVKNVLSQKVFSDVSINWITQTAQNFAKVGVEVLGPHQTKKGCKIGGVKRRNPQRRYSFIRLNLCL